MCQAMRFGDLPTWAIKLSNSIREAVLLSDNDLASCDGDKEACPLASDLLWREPLFDQLIVNVYQPGEVGYNFLSLLSCLLFRFFHVFLLQFT